MLIQAPVLTCKPLFILSSKKPPKCRVRALLCRDSLFDEQHKLPDACPDHNLSIFFRFKNSLYTSIIHIFLQDKGSELMWTYLIYFWAMIRTGKFKGVLQMVTCLSNIKGPGRLWFLSSVSMWIKKKKISEEKVKQKWNNACVQKYTEQCVLERNVVLGFFLPCIFFILYCLHFAYL